MSANGFSFLQIVSLILCLAGFHGLFFYENLGRKAAAWLVFQGGMLFFFFPFISAGGPVPKVLALETGGVGLSVFLLLGFFCLRLWKKHKTLEADEIAKRGSK